jgi:hypothetical protein
MQESSKIYSPVALGLGAMSSVLFEQEVLFAPEAVARSVEEKYGLPLAKIER